MYMYMHFYDQKSQAQMSTWNPQNHDYQKYLWNIIVLQGNSQSDVR